MNKAKALVLQSSNNLVIEERPVPVPGPTDVLIRIAFAAICHTDFFTLRGQYPGCKYPTVLGHEFSGIVERCGEGVTHVKPGNRVTALSYAYCGTCPACRRGRHTGCHNAKSIPFQMDGAFQEMVLVPSLMVYPVPDSFRLDEAALTEPAANGFSAAQRSEIYPGERVVIIGPGPIGLLALQAAVLKQPGSLIMLGTRRERLEMAIKFGATQVVNVRENDPYKSVMDLTGGFGADVVLFCGGGEDAWRLIGRILAHSGRVVIESLPESRDTQWPVPVFDFTAKQLSYLGVSGYTGAQFGTTLELMQAGKINVAPLITHRFALDDYQAAFETSEKRKNGAIKVIFEIGKEKGG